MDIPLFRLLRRHWYASLPLLLVGAAAALALHLTSASVYHVSGAFMLASASTDPGRLPAAHVDLDAIEERALDREPGDGVVGEAEFTVFDSSTFQVRARADTPRAAERAVSDYASWVAEELATQQEPVAEELRLEPQTLTPDIRAREDGPVYEASAIYWIAGLGGAAENPLGRGSGTIRLLRVAAANEAAQERLASAAGADADYQLSHDTRDIAPIVTMSATASTPERAERAYATVVAIVEEELDRRQAQADVPAQLRIYIDHIAPAGTPTPDPSRDLRPLVALFLAFLAASAAAGGLEWRDRRRPVAAEPDPADRDSATSPHDLDRPSATAPLRTTVAPPSAPQDVASYPLDDLRSDAIKVPSDSNPHRSYGR